MADKAQPQTGIMCPLHHKSGKELVRWNRRALKIATLKGAQLVQQLVQDTETQGQLKRHLKDSLLQKSVSWKGETARLLNSKTSH